MVLESSGDELSTARFMPVVLSRTGPSVIIGVLPASNSGVYFQDTKLYPLGDVQENDPYCEFDMGAATAAGQVLKGTFAVSVVDYDENGVGTDGTAVSITVINLQQSSTGEACRMNCMLPLLSRDARFVTLPEIRGAMGGCMDLKVAPQRVVFCGARAV